MDAGLIGGLLGAVLGILGGAFGTYCSIRNTRGPLERAFMVKASVMVWVGVTIFLALLLLLPRPYNHLMWIIYGIALPLGIIRINKTLAAIRAREGTADRPPPA